MRILILGAGGVGGYFGGRLVQAGQEVAFLVRPGRALQLQRDGLVIESPLGNLRVPVRCVTAEEVRPEFDALILTCKAYDLDSAIAAVEPAVGAGTLILPLLNGLAHIDRLDEQFGAHRVLGGLCQLAVTLTETGTIRHLNRTASIAYGSRDPRTRDGCAAIDEAFRASGVDAEWSQDIVRDLWEKFVFLTTLAGMTCLMRGAVGDIVQTSHGKDAMLELLDSCRRTAAAAGVALRPESMLRVEEQVTDPGSTLTASMLRDVERGGRTEADHILGDMLRRAEEAGLDATLLRLADCHLQTYERRRLREAAVAGR
jgi:2-dehydropantoate 2-reductase